MIMRVNHCKVYGMKTKEYYLAQELADKLRVNVMTIYRYIKAGRLEAYKIGRDFRVNKKEFIRFLEKAKTQ